MDLHRSLVGTIFAGDYLVESLLAEGGMGAVYAVEQRSTGRRRALKLLRAALVSDRDTRERFVREAKVSSRIESDHVVSVIDAGVDEQTNVPFIVMELLEGEDLARYVQSHGVLEFATSLEVLRQLGHALAAAHAVGVIHRDLKPENVFVARTRRADVAFTVKLVDFGIAAIIESSATSHVTGAVVGSPAWMAPEQVDTGLLRPSTDVWALGLLAFWLFTGRHYWKSANQTGATLQALLVEKLVEPLEPASVRARLLGADGRIPSTLDPWFARCICRDPAGRFSDAAQAIEALRAAIAASARAEVSAIAVAVAPTVVAGPTGPLVAATASPRRSPNRSPSRAPIALGLAALVVAGAGTAAIVAAKGNASRDATNGPEHASARATSAGSSTRERSADDGPRVARMAGDAAAAAIEGVSDAAVAVAPSRERPSQRTPQRAARTITTSTASAPTRGSVVDAGANASSNVAQPGPASVAQPAPAGMSGPPGPRPNRCAAYAGIERRAQALLQNATAIEPTDPRQAQRDRVQAISLRQGVDEQVAHLRMMARGDLAGDPDFVAMVRDVNECIARLRAQSP